MKCPYCGSNDLKVTDTRTKGNYIKRKRQCIKCKGTFYTIEVIDLSEVMVQKRNGSLQAFNKISILRGLKRAFNKINISEEEIENILDNIEMEIYSKKTNIVKSEEIGNIVCKYLKKVNDIAYLRFLSVYKKYNTLDEFNEEISKCINERKKNQENN